VESGSGTTRGRLSFALFLITLPALIFYALLFRTAVSLPILDDYQIILDTTDHISTTYGLLPRLAIVLNSQHNGYKLVFENLVVWAMYSVTGHIHMLALVVLGNAFALLIFLIVVRMARGIETDTATRLLTLAPVAYLLLQLQYASALNFASSSLQHLAVVAFSLLAIYLLSTRAKGAFVGGCLAMVLAVASSPNGFFLAPVGVCLLVQEKRWRDAAAWAGLFAPVLGFYLFHYAPAPAGASGGSQGATALLHIHPVYVLSFVGASAARYASVLPSVLLGVVLCGVFGFAIQRRYFRQNPAVFYSMLFILINAVAVSFLRSDSGVAQSLASRYRTYSNLMLAFSYIFLVENVVPRARHARTHARVVSAALVLSMAFCAVSDVAGARFLAGKKVALTRTYALQMGRTSSIRDMKVADTDINPALQRQIVDGVYNVNLPILRESMRLGVYCPPDLP
jgi:hypothetical protein